jgi:hypothetical protein
MTVTFAYYLIGFELKYLGGDIYVNTIVASVAEICGKLLASPTIVKLGINKLYFIAFLIAGIGSGLLIPYGQHTGFLPTALLLITRFGTSMGIVGAYIGILLLIPTQFACTSMGLCNFFGRGLSMMAPLIVEAP